MKQLQLSGHAVFCSPNPHVQLFGVGAGGHPQLSPLHVQLLGTCVQLQLSAAAVPPLRLFSC